MHQDTKLVFMYYVKCFNSAYNILRISEWPEFLANILARDFLKQVSGSGSRGPVIELGSRRPTWWHSMITFLLGAFDYTSSLSVTCDHVDPLRQGCNS